MTPFQSQRGHVARLFESLRLQRGLRPGGLAERLGAANPSRVGSLIRGFELGEPIGDHWLERLLAELQPDPAELRRCVELDQIDAADQLQRERIAWEAWADQPIEPFLAIRRWPLARGDEIRNVPHRFSSNREDAEMWAAAQLKSLRSTRVTLVWSRKELTIYEAGQLKPCRSEATFDAAQVRSATQLTESQYQRLLGFRG